MVLGSLLVCSGIGVFFLLSSRSPTPVPAPPVVVRNDPPPVVPPTRRNDPPPTKKDPPPRERLALPAAPAALEIKPPTLAQDGIVQLLPGTVASVAVGGGGRYLIFHLPKQEQLAVFDVNEARIVHTIPAADKDVKFSAGMNALLVVLPAAQTIERWSLATGKRETTAPLPDAESVRSACLGSASAGPLLLCRNTGQVRNRFQLLDVDTLKPLTLNWNIQRFPEAAFVRASADGRTFVFREGVGGEPHNMSLIRLGEDATTLTTEGSVASSLLVPGPDAAHIYGGNAVYDNALQAVHPTPAPEVIPRRSFRRRTAAPCSCGSTSRNGKRLAGRSASSRPASGSRSPKSGRSQRCRTRISTTARTATR